MFLVRGLLPFLQAHIWPVSGRRAFYIRYEDEQGEHLRIRLRGDDAVLENLFAEHMADRGRWSALAYVPEPERFGGPDKLPWAEEHFHMSTRVALERLARPTHVYGDALYDAMNSFVIAAHTAGLKRAESVSWFGDLYRHWLPLFFPLENEKPGEGQITREIVLSHFEKSLQQQGADLRDSLNTLWQLLESQRIGFDRPEWLRWLRGNELILPEFGDDTLRVASSLLHLHANRLGVNNQDEVFILYLLANCL